MELMILYFCCQSSGSFGGLGKDTDTPNWPIKTVDKSKIDIAWLVVFILEILLAIGQKIKIIG